MSSPTEKLKDRLRGLKNPLQNLRRDSLGSSSPVPGASAASWRGVAKELTFSEAEMAQPAIIKDENRTTGPDGEAARFPSDPLVDDEILEGMEQQYYLEDFNPSEFELKLLPETLDQHVIHGDRQRLLSQLTVVAKRAFSGILDKQSACLKEMDRVVELQSQLSSSLTSCRMVRRGLVQARQEFTASSLGILAAYRRRQHAVSLLHDLNIIRTLQKTDERLQELLGEEDFPGAIQLILECQKAISTYNHFTAVRQLAAKLQDTLEMAEEQLDVTLAKVCVDFNPLLYRRLHKAYRLLGKTQMSMDQLHMHVTSAVHNTAWNVVFGHAVLSSCAASDDGGGGGGGASESDLARRPYADLCGAVAPASVVPCLVDLCRALWGIMNSYQRISQWHAEKDREEKEVTLEEDLERQYVSRKLESGCTRIWQDVQTKTRVFVMANDLSWLGIDAFLEFMDVIHKLIKFGHCFCGSASDTLQESLKKKCWSYFHSYHLARLEELQMHLENEGWALCPVRDTFRAQQLVEYRHLKQPPPTMSPTKRPLGTSQGGGGGSNYDSTPSPLELSPFDPNYDDSFDDEEEGVLSTGCDATNGNIGREEGFYSDDDEDSDEGISEELRRDFVDEDQVVATEREPEPDEGAGGQSQHTPRTRKYNPRGSARCLPGEMAPVLTNTSLMILRLCGKYLHLMRALQPIASSVFTSMTQLLDYYLLVVHTFFTQNLSAEQRGQVTREELSSALRQIEDDLVLRRVAVARSGTAPNITVAVTSSPAISQSASSHSVDSPVHEGPLMATASPTSATTGLVALPRLPDHPVASAEHPETLFGLAEKFVAAESTVFLAKQLSALLPVLLGFLPEEEQALVQEYKEKIMDFIPHLRRPVYMTVAAASIRPDVILQMMTKVAWDIKEVRSQHSQYVEVMLRDFQLFSMRLQELRRSLRIPAEVRKVLWDLCTLCAANIFVEGFSNAKKCSNEGRALMQLDYRQFLVKLEKMTEQKPVPYQDYVDSYVKAYYIPEMDLEAWVSQHNKEYSAKQLVSLVNCVAYSNKKTKQRLNSLISELSGRIRR